MIIAVDFDGVIHQRSGTYGKMGEPVEGARDALIRLRKQGHTLIVHTVRGDSPDHVAQWLDKYKFPVMLVTRQKPVADVYLDDKALHFDNWRHVLEMLADNRR